MHYYRLLITKSRQIVLLLILLLSITTAYATLNLQLNQGIHQALPIAIVAFGNKADIIQKIIIDDLQNSGMFKVLSPQKLPQHPSTIDQVQFEKWRALGINNLVIGHVEKTKNDHYCVTFTLLDVFKSQQFLHFTSLSQATVESTTNPVLIHQRYNIHKSQMEALAHHLADSIYHKLTAIPGVFSSHIAYVLVQRQKQRPPRYILEIADSNGRNPQPLFTSSSPIMSLTWSPHSDKIAYVSFEHHKAAVYISTLANGHRKLIASFAGINSAPAWSPNGKELALALSQGYINPNIYIINLQTKALRQITHGNAINTEPTWSPQGNTLLFTSNRGGSPQIYRINLQTKQLTRLTFTGNYNAHPLFSPDGNTVIMLHRHQGKFDIAIKHLQTGAFQLLTHSGFNDSPTVAPNGQMILYSSYYHGRKRLAMVTIDGQYHHYLPQSQGDMQSPAWGS